MKIYSDAMGEIEVEEDKYWGASTQRSFENFKIGPYKMPLDLIYAISIVKEACAFSNYKLDTISKEKYETIKAICKKIRNKEYDNHFPLSVFQTGSGTQTNMNVNEVIANIALEKYGVKLHPNDDVNKSQSSNDVFPSAMHISIYKAYKESLEKELNDIIKVLLKLEEKFSSYIKIGRTHLQDAVPMKVSDEFSAYRYSIQRCKEFIDNSFNQLLYLAIGGSAVGSGLNTKDGYSKIAVEEIKNITGFDFKESSNKFHALSMKDEICYASGALKTLAMDLIKIANDIRFLGCGPRCGFSELKLPANEPGSSIMPGKVNPTQTEALTMVCSRVLGNDATISFTASQGHFQLNTYMPITVFCFLESIYLLSDAISSFSEKCLKGIELNEEKINYYLENSLMLVTALNPYIGYDNACKCAKYAYKENISLKEAVIKLMNVSCEQVDIWLDPKSMVKE